MRYHDYLYLHPDLSVPEDVFTGSAAEISCLEFQYDALQAMGANDETLEYVQEVDRTNYWNLDFEQRWW